MSLTVLVGGKDVTRFVDADSLPGVTVRAESDSLWDFRTDALDVELDWSVLAVWGYDVYNYGGLEKQPVVIQDDDRLVFGGAVTGAAYNHNTETLTLTLESYGAIAARMTIEHVTAHRASLEWVLDTTINDVNDALIAGGWPFVITGKAVNVRDYAFYRSVDVTFTIPGARNFGNYLAVDTIGGLVTDRDPDSVYYGKHFLHYFVTDRNTDRQLDWYVPVTENGLDADNYVEENPAYMPEAADAIPDGLKTLIKFAGNFSNPTYSGQAKLRDGLYYLYATDGAQKYLIRAEVIDNDFLNYSYSDTVKAGALWADVAKMLNAVIWIGPDAVLYVQSRDGRGEVAAGAPLRVETEYNNRDEVFEVPDAFILLDDVKNALVDYYADWLAGRFVSSRITIPADDIDDHPPLLKTLSVDMAGRRVDMGLIIAAEYADGVVNLETMRRDG
ncbi:MAG: hypothetical protein D6800_11025 [Candidatus Zixiibacteriota bacterium]|nr:MAG: hypothetical protein D6800_11025 [candidate division Zixibacteria bacterium]